MLPIKGIPVHRPSLRKLAASTSHCSTIANAISLSTMFSLMQSNSIKLITPIADFKIPKKIDTEGEITDVIKH